MKRFIVTPLLCTLFLTACSGLKSAARQPVPGADKPMISSSFKPETEEQCTQVATEKCPYWSIDMAAAYPDCMKHVVNKANEVKADYLWYDDQVLSINGVKTNSPNVYMYTCKNLKN